MTVIDKKRIATNTLMLAVRMGVLLIVKLYTVNVVLAALGAVDYGIYNTVAGVVMTFSFLNDTMSTACQRFLAFSMGKNDNVEVRRIFSLCVIAFAAIAILIVILCETAGLPLLHKRLNLDGRSMEVAHAVFQLAILSFFFTIVRTPFQGMVVIKEKMKVYSYMGILEAFGFLAVGILISYGSHDRLVYYSVLMMSVSALVALGYVAYCNVFYSESRFKFYWNTEKFKEIFVFTFWNMFGSLAMSLKSYGINVLINMFFNNVMVTARTMAYKIYGMLLDFSGNITTAVKPQIIKAYSDGEKDGMFKLVFQGSKFASYLFLIVAIPMFFEAPFILDLWLPYVPDYTVLFTRLCIVNGLLDVLVTPLAASMQAYGKIRTYQITCSFFIMLVVPVSYFLLKIGFPPETVFYVSILVCALAIVLRVVFINHYIGMPIGGYFKNVMWPMCYVAILASVIPAILESVMDYGVTRFITVGITSVFMVCLVAYALGMSETEKKHTKEYLLKIIHKNNG